jgi:hypothetical protein
MTRKARRLLARVFHAIARGLDPATGAAQLKMPMPTDPPPPGGE